MDAWELDFYTDLGRHVKCPYCGKHSDLTLDRPEAQDDWLSYAQRVSTELTKEGCLEFHRDPLLAWLWFKHQVAHPTPKLSSEEPDDKALLPVLAAPYEPPGPPALSPNP